MARPKTLPLQQPDESAPAEAEAPQQEPHKRMYQTLMGLSCTGPGGYRYLRDGELLELSREEAEPLLASGAIKPAE